MSQNVSWKNLLLNLLAPIFVLQCKLGNHFISTIKAGQQSTKSNFYNVSNSKIGSCRFYLDFSWFQFHEKYCKTSDDGCDFTENRVKTATKGLVTNVQINSELENVNKLSFET